MRRNHEEQIVVDLVAVETVHGFLFGIDGTSEEFVMLLDAAAAALGIHPHGRVAGVSGGLGIAGKIFDRDAVADAAFFKIAIEHPLRFIGGWGTAIRPERNADDNAPAVEGLERAPRLHRRLELPSMM